MERNMLRPDRAYIWDWRNNGQWGLRTAYGALAQVLRSRHTGPREASAWLTAIGYALPRMKRRSDHLDLGFLEIDNTTEKCAICGIADHKISRIEELLP